MPHYTVIPTTQEHGAYLAPRLRASAKAELDLLGLDPAKVLAEHIAVSRDTWTGLVDGEPICCFGIKPFDILAAWGHPWLTGTEAMDLHGRVIARGAVSVVAHWKSTYTALQTTVDGRNLQAIKWLLWLRMTIPAEPITVVAGVPFYRAYWHRK